MSHAQAVPSRLVPIPADGPSAPVPPIDPTGDDSLASMLRLARSLALLVALLAGLLFLILLFVFVLGSLFGFGTGGLLGVAYCFLSAVVNYLLWREVPQFQRLAAEARYGELRERLLLWTVLGLLFFVILGVVLVFAYLGADERARGGPPSTTASQPPPGALGSGGPPSPPPSP